MTQKERRKYNWPFPDFQELSQHDLETRVKLMDEWVACSPLEITRVQGRRSTPYWQELLDLHTIQADEYIYALMANDPELKRVVKDRSMQRSPLLNKLFDDAEMVSRSGRKGKHIVERSRFFRKKIERENNNA